jgi:hypothetical protein
MSDDRTAYFRVRVKFGPTENAEFPLRAVVENQTWVIRVNDFPVQDMFTLIIDDEEIFDFNGWPHNWKRPFYDY